MIKSKIYGGALALLFAAASVFAGPHDYDYAFPSPLPPTGDTTGVKQIISFIWDDNAYSGKVGTNYEGDDYPNSGKAFTDVSWVGGKRVEGDWSTTGKNADNIKEGDYGMSWAAKTLSGYPSEQAMRWLAAADYKQGDEVIYNGALWKARAWTGKGTVPGSNYPPANNWDPGWDKVKDLSGIQPSKKNPDGSPITMTFNVITGLIVSAFPITWESRESKYGYYVPNAEFYSDGKILHTKISVTWGREYAIYNTKAGNDAQDDKQMFGLPYLADIFQEAIDLGHEVGNHTIDHMETNSPLPSSASNPYPAKPNGAAYMDGFAKWGNEGMDRAEIDTVIMPDGEKLITDEAREFAQRKGNIWQYMGWQGYAGKVLSKTAWKGLIALAETELTSAYKISASNGKCVAFRAPRLEVSSGLFWALKELGYVYDCGNEEGYEYNMDGTNYLWPYTTDNGSPNVAWQRMVGENKSNFDSLPSGVWEYPVAVLVIPQNERQGVFNNYKQIAAAEGNAPTSEDEQEFLKNGKITGFDFNLFILNGATKEAAIATMRHSLDQRMKGGKAPMQIGCHTDYFTPIYDNATLRNDANKDTYGLVVGSKGGTPWNTWRDRIAVWEDIRNYGIEKGAYLWDGKKAIDYVKTLVAAARVGSTEKDISEIGEWEFFTHENKSSANTLKFSGNIVNAEINTQASEEETAGYAVYGDEGDFKFDHISLSYSTSAPLTIRLITDDAIDEAYPYEVTLSNLNGFDADHANKSYFAHSGQIPVSAFQRNQYVGNDYPNLVGLRSIGTDFTEKITGIEVAVQVPENKAQKTSLSIKDFKLYSGEQTQGIVVGIANKQKVSVQKIAVQVMSSNALKLNLAKAGVYNIDIFTINGRVVKSFKNENLSSGLNTLPLSNIAKGMYMIRIHNKNFSTSLKSPVL